MSVQELKSLMPEFAKDIKLNISSVMTEEGSVGLTQQQILGTALASSLSTQNSQLVNLIMSECDEELSEDYVNGVKAAVSVMAMNNIYYRFIHLTSNKDYSTMPAKLRMSKIANPGIPKIDFEIYSLAVSSINGCGMCMDSHEKQLLESGVSKEGVQSAIRIAATMTAAAQVLSMG